MTFVELKKFKNDDLENKGEPTARSHPAPHSTVQLLFKTKCLDMLALKGQRLEEILSKPPGKEF